MPSERRERVYVLLDDLVEEVGGMQGAAYRAGNLDDAAWLACAEDALQRFADAFDDRVDAEAERRWDRQAEKDLEDMPNGAMELAQMAEASRRLK